MRSREVAGDRVRTHTCSSSAARRSTKAASVSPGKPSSDDALKLATKLGADGAASDQNQCPTFVSIKRGASLRAKDVVTHFFRRRSQNAFETWATSQLKVDVTFRNSVKADVVLYWHDPHVRGAVS